MSQSRLISERRFLRRQKNRKYHGRKLRETRLLLLNKRGLLK